MCTFLVVIFLFRVASASYSDYLISDEVQCQCVPAHLCADNDEGATGQGILDIRFENDPCPNHFDVCCDMPRPPSEEPPLQKCGFSKSGKIGPRITADSRKASIGELPWTVLVLDSAPGRERNSFKCGGSLIHPQVAITAGHCVANSESNSVKVRAGEWNIRSESEPLPHQDEFVKEILLHPQYKAGTLWNDIALLILNQPFVLHENIGFICLWAGKFKIDGENCVASGWGRKAMGDRKLSPVLRKVTLPLVGRSRCQKALRETKLGRSFRLHRSFMCAGGERNRDTCKGDGGSPLICPLMGEERFVQMGVVSWGVGCGEDKTPGVYVNLAMFKGWIDKQMKVKNFSTSYYDI